jgi:hypothetical protein
MVKYDCKKKQQKKIRSLPCWLPGGMAEDFVKGISKRNK